MLDIWRSIRSSLRSERLTSIDWIFLILIIAVALWVGETFGGNYDRAVQKLVLGVLIVIYGGARWLFVRMRSSGSE